MSAARKPFVSPCTHQPSTPRHPHISTQPYQLSSYTNAILHTVSPSSPAFKSPFFALTGGGGGWDLGTACGAGG